jgi:ATP-binding cassette subfamily B multidrug efflux pump
LLAHDLSPPRQTARSLALLRPLFWRYRFRIVSGILALVGVDLCQLWIPRVVKFGIDSLESGVATHRSLAEHGLVIIALAVGVAIFRFLWRNLILGFSRLMERDLRDQLFSHLLSLDRSFFQKRTTGELMALATNDLTAVQMASGMGMIAMIDSIVMTAAVLMFMVYINPRLTLIALSPLPILAVLTRFLSGRLHQRFSRVQETFSEMTELARSTINAMRLVKIYTREADQTARFDQLGRRYITHNLRVATIQGLLFPVSGLLANTSLLLVVIIGGRMAINSIITIGDLVAFISYLFMLVWPMMAMGWVTNLFQRGLTSLGRIRMILDERPALICDGLGLPLPGPVESIELRDLTFTYDGQRAPVLHGITLTIGPGLFGLVGPTGSGKSTLCHLLARLYPVPAGTIFINGEELNRLDISGYRRSVAYAPQEPFLFADTIAANIGFGRPEATAEEIEEAARAVGIHDEIVIFKEGYGSRIGEKGVMLSGGQRQRISLARALITRAPVLIIDDGISAVDAGTEQQIMATIGDYAREHIVIMASHRLAPLAHASRLAVLEEGRLTALGNHHDLLAANDYYRAIFHKQTEPDAGRATHGA